MTIQEGSYYGGTLYAGLVADQENSLSPDGINQYQQAGTNEPISGDLP